MAHILLAEDDESLRKFLAAALVKAGHAVTDFGDGSDAWECIQGFTFDLLWEPRCPAEPHVETALNH